jgi:L-threonylcarbamoyladenylate synthase
MTIEEAARIIQEGGVVAFPTETVYGLGANALDRAAIRRIYELKGRPSTSPLIVHVDSIEMAQTLAADWPVIAEGLARRYWPGPLTMVVRKSSSIPDEATAGLDTVGLRMPAHPVALALIRACGVPLAAPSANRFMRLSPTTAAHVREAFGESLPVLDGGPTVVGIESTVISVIDGGITLLRPGMIQVPGAAAIAGEAPAGAAHSSPGLHHRHYSPLTPLVLLDPERPVPEGAAYIWYRMSKPARREVQLPDDPAGYAAAIYGALHELDGLKFTSIAVEQVPEDARWSAVSDRLHRAAAAS